MTSGGSTGRCSHTCKHGDNLRVKAGVIGVIALLLSRDKSVTLQWSKGTGETRFFMDM